MCQRDGRCPTHRHLPGTRCPYSGRRGLGGVVALVGVLAVGGWGYTQIPELRQNVDRAVGDSQKAADGVRTAVKDAPRAPREHEGTCKVAWVTDGDTFRCRSGVKVRILGLDAPELAHDGRRADCWGQESRRALTKVLKGRTVTLRVDPGQDETDTYGRLLAYVDAGTGDVSTQMITAGDARARTSRPPLVRAEDLADAERSARGRQAGLWSTCQKR